MWFLRFLCMCGVLLVLGCSRQENDLVRARSADGGAGGTSTTITGSGGEAGAPPCCVTGNRPPFQGLSWFQFSEPGWPGTCPAPSVPGLTGYAEMKVDPHTCPACTCSPAACTLPEGIHTNAAKCSDADGSIAIPFGPDPAAGWEGACSDSGALPANVQCGGVPCIQSLTVPAVPFASCQPASGPAAPFPAPVWGRMARECVLDPLSGEGCEPNQVCAPVPPEGFELCLHVVGDIPDCPSDYPVQSVFYTGVNDARECSACQCASPEGAQCAAILSAFSGAACSSLVVSVLVTDAEPTCVDVPSGTALGSAEASMVVDVPGSCAQSGGAPSGHVEPSAPLTLCCQGDPPAPG